MLHRRRALSVIALTPVAFSAVAVPIARAEDDLHRPVGGGGPVGGSSSVDEDARHNGADADRVALSPAGPIGQDLELAGGFRVVRTYGVHFGALPFVLEGEGERFQLDVLRRDAAGPSGVYETERFSVFVHDHGAFATIPARERGARALGAALERRVAAGVEVPSLASFA
ncbi:MAG: hypothetical protein M3Y87_27550, partial [Myxococcota bacterium]|nr:hypothetical protein [Myxococcota bacterium]